jgi:hypothetical protein
VTLQLHASCTGLINVLNSGLMLPPLGEIRLDASVLRNLDSAGCWQCHELTTHPLSSEFHPYPTLSQHGEGERGLNTETKEGGNSRTGESASGQLSAASVARGCILRRLVLGPVMLSKFTLVPRRLLVLEVASWRYKYVPASFVFASSPL